MRHVTLLSLLFISCQNGYDNVQACEDWLEASFCDEVYGFPEDACGEYAEYECDLSELFDCRMKHDLCDWESGIPDLEPGTDLCEEFLTCEPS